MASFPLTVNPPQGVSYAAPLIDFSPLAKLGDSFFQGAKNKTEYDAAQALKQGLPTDADGNIDYGKAAQMLAQTGNLGAVSQLAQIGALTTKTLPPGYRRSPNGGYEAIPGGPADPVVMTAIERKKRELEQEFAPKTVDIKRPGPFGDTQTETMMKGPNGFTPIPATGGQSAAPNAGINPSTVQNDLTGDEYLKTLPGPLQSIVKKVANYEIDPRSLSIRGGHREKIMSAASQYNPDFDAALAPARFAAIKEFNSGGLNAPAGVITSGNTAIQHLKTLSDVSQKIGGASNWGPFNSILNRGNVAYKGAENDPNLAEYNNALGRFAEEATKFYRGIGGTDTDIRQALELVTAAQSPEARNRAIATQAELMQSKINALQDRWRQATGSGGWKSITASGDFPIVAKKSQAAMDAIMKRAGHAPPGTAPAEPGAQRTGAGTSGDILQQARDAIAKGADKNAVIERLKQNGIDPAGL